MARHIFLFLAIALVAITYAQSAKAQVNERISYQGFLRDGDGKAVEGTVSLTYRLYDAEIGGTRVWEETHTSVAVSNGVFDVFLGSSTPLSNVAFSGSLYLGISVNGGVEMAPRMQLAATPKALTLRGLRVVPASDIHFGDVPNILGGAEGNSVTTGVVGAAIGGGGNSGPSPEPNRVTDHLGTIGGGLYNQAGDDGGTLLDAWAATVAGGYDNTAAGMWATVGGGRGNSSRAETATVSGGWNNKAVHGSATVPGGFSNEARGLTSFAAGFKARAIHNGAFVWNDRSAIGGNDSLLSTADNQFLVRAVGGVTFYTGLDDSDASTGATLPPGSGSWSSVSDRKSKEAFASVEPADVLARLARVPITTWRYKGQQAHIQHMGPMAQDFFSAFGLGEDERHIATVDADGVAMAAIQGLLQLLQKQQAEIAVLRAGLDDLNAIVGVRRSVGTE